MATGSAYVIAYAEDATPPTIDVAKSGVTLTRTADNQDIHSVITFVVPPDYYYKVDDTTTGGTCTLVSWLEWTLH